MSLAVLHSIKTVKMRIIQEAELMRLRFSLGLTRLKKIRNERIRGTSHVFTLIWGQTCRRETGVILPCYEEG